MLHYDNITLNYDVIMLRHSDVFTLWCYYIIVLGHDYITHGVITLNNDVITIHSDTHNVMLSTLHFDAIMLWHYADTTMLFYDVTFLCFHPIILF